MLSYQALFKSFGLLAKKPIAYIVLLTLLSLFAAQGCGGEQQEVLVFAGASLSNVLEQQGKRFTQETDIKVVFHLGGSTELASQIIRGGPADLFIAAGSRPMDSVEKAGLLQPGTRVVDLLTNELVLVEGAGTEREVRSLEEVFAGEGRIAIADPELAPAGYYAREALKNLGLWDGLLPRLVFGTNVRTTITYVKSGNVDAGIVYCTDALATNGIHIIASLPQESYPVIIYPGAVIAQSASPAEAERFLQFLQGDEAREIFRRNGFERANPPKTDQR